MAEMTTKISVLKEEILVSASLRKMSVFSMILAKSLVSENVNVTFLTAFPYFPRLFRMIEIEYLIPGPAGSGVYASRSSTRSRREGGDRAKAPNARVAYVRVAF